MNSVKRTEPSCHMPSSAGEMFAWVCPYNRCLGRLIWTSVRAQTRLLQIRLFHENMSWPSLTSVNTGCANTCQTNSTPTITVSIVRVTASSQGNAMWDNLACRMMKKVSVLLFIQQAEAVRGLITFRLLVFTFVHLRWVLYWTFWGCQRWNKFSDPSLK